MSRLPFELLLALRYLRPKRTFVSIITFISVIGVSLGVAVLIIVISVMTGFDRELRSQVFGFSAHLTIFEINPATGRQDPMHDYTQVMDIVNSNQEVVSSSPLAIGPVLLETEFAGATNQGQAVPFLRGYDPDATDKLEAIMSRIAPPGTNDLSGNGLLVGYNLADDLDLHVGDRVVISSPKDIDEMLHSGGTNGPKVVVPPKDFEVRGIFKTGYYDYDDKVAFCSLGNFQDMYRMDDNVQAVMVRLKDEFQSNRVCEELRKALGSRFIIKTWQETNNMMTAVLVEKNVMYYIMFFIVIVAAFGITCTEITFVVLKTREIGVVKALGASGRQVVSIFLLQSMIVSTMGVVTGLVGGILLVHYRNPFLHLMRSLTGWELFPADIYGFTELPALLVASDLLIICGGSFLICLLAAAFPAWHASRLKPVEALRHE